MSRLVILSLLVGFSAVACNPQAPQNPPTEITAAEKTDAQTFFPVTISQIAEGVWVHTSNYNVPGQKPIPSNGLIVENGDSLILVDTAWGEMATQSLLDTIKDEIGKPVESVIITHHHNDRVVGVDLLEARGVTAYTHPDTPALAAASGLPVPNTSVAALKNAGSRSKVGTVEIAYPGPGHAQENLVVYVPKAGILFGGCMVKGAGSQGMGNIADADLKVWPASLNWIKATYPDTQMVVPGHGKGANLTLIDHTLALIASEVNREAKTAREQP